METIQIEDTTIYKTLADLLALQKDIEAKVQEAKQTLLAEMEANGEEKVQTEYGSFTVASRKSYTYTDAVKKLEEKVKLAKVKEEQTGTATKKITQYIVYSNKK